MNIEAIENEMKEALKQIKLIQKYSDAVTLARNNVQATRALVQETATACPNDLAEQMKTLARDLNKANNQLDRALENLENAKSDFTQAKSNLTGLLNGCTEEALDQAA